MGLLTINKVNGIGNLTQSHKWELKFTDPTGTFTQDELEKIAILVTETTLPALAGVVTETMIRGIIHRQKASAPNGGALPLSFPEDEEGIIANFFRKWEKLSSVQNDQSQAVTTGFMTGTLSMYSSNNTLKQQYKFYECGLTTYTPVALGSDVATGTGSAELFFQSFDYAQGEAGVTSKGEYRDSE